MGSQTPYWRKPGQPPPVYVIRIEGQLDPLWAEWFEGFSLSNQPNENQVVMRGPVTDQSALHGLLNRIRDLNLTIISVERISYPGCAVFKAPNTNES